MLTDLGGDISLFALGTMLLQWRRRIAALGLLGATIAVAWALLTARVYPSTATFIPQASEAENLSGLAAAASQFGLALPSAANVWGPPIYAELLESDALLRAVALDTLAVAENGGPPEALMDLLKVNHDVPAVRLDHTIHKLRDDIVDVSTDKNTNSVKVTVTTKWPSVSLAIAQQLLKSVNQFNLETKQSQASAERAFVEAQAADAEHALRAAEDALQVFLERNRTFSSPQFEFAHDRLQRDVTMRQTVYTTLMQNLEQAKIRQVRDTPVITVLEVPQLPAVPASRHLVLRVILGGFAGAAIGMLIAFLARSLEAARGTPTSDAREFFGLVEQHAPWLRIK